MFDYYHHFAEKGNHPDVNDILALEEKYRFEEFTFTDACRIANGMLEAAENKYQKPVGIRITMNGIPVIQILVPPFDMVAVDWLVRKEKTVMETKHSSYAVFLDNITSHKNDHMIFDESYAICGGGFPLIIGNTVAGSVACTGLAPDEDHDVVMSGIRACFDSKNNG